jgi:hypothetical protein
MYVWSGVWSGFFLIFDDLESAERAVDFAVNGDEHFAH